MPPITKLRSLQINPGNLWVGDGTPDTSMGGGDVHIEGTLEVDGALNFDGGIDIGACTTGINFSGDMTYGINMTDSLSATDAILIAGDNADAIHISGDNTVTALHISGDQAIGILYDVDAAATDGLKFDVDSSKTLTRGIYLTGDGTVTTALLIDTDGTTAINVTDGFSGVDMIVLNGTASGYGIEISGTCTTADLILQGGGLINDAGTASGGSGDVLAITQDMIQLTGQVEVGYTDWGVAGAGAIQLVEASGWDWAFQANACLGVDVTGTAVAAAYHSNTITVTQTGSTSAFGTWTELYFSDSVDFSAADNAAAVWGQIEVGDDFSAPATSGDFLAAFYANVKSGDTFTTGASSVVNGVRVKGEIDTTTISHDGRLAAFECLTESGDQDWDYGLYVSDVTNGIYIAKGTGRAFQVGALSSATQTGMTFVASTGIEAVSVYTDDGNATLSGGDPFVGIHSRSMFFKNQDGGTTCLGVFGQQKYASGVEIGEARTSAVEGYQEFMTTNNVVDDGIVAGVNSIIECSAGTLTVEDGGILAGFMARLSSGSGTAVQDVGGILAGLYIDENIGTGDWGYGVYVGSGDMGLYIAAGGNRAIQVGELASDDQVGMTFVEDTGYEAVSVYTDDGNVALDGGDPFVGIHSRSMFFKDQANGTTCLGLFGQQKYASAVDIGPARVAAVEGYQEFMTTNQVKDAGIVAGVSSVTDVVAGVVTVASGGILAGLHAKLTGAGQLTQSSGGIAAALYVDESVTTGTWGYGAYITGATTAIYIDPTTCTSGIQIGEATTDATGGLSFGTTAPVGLYFDDGGSAVSAWGECMTVGLVIPTESKSGMTGWPCATHVYTDQRADLTGSANHNMCALNASYLIRNNATLDGFDNFAVSAFNPNVNIDSGSELASGTTLACISFSGNWNGTVNGKIVPLHVATTNYNFSAFAQFAEANGCYQDAAAGSGGHKYLKMYLGNTLYTIDMVTA